MSKSFDAFLSYSSSDERFVDRLKLALEACGLKVWRDRDEILPGDLIVGALERGLAASRAVALVVSPNSLRSGWVQEEYSRAIGLCHSGAQPARLVPILLKGAELPGFLGNRSYVDFREEERFEQSVYALVRGIRGDEAGASRPGKRLALLDRRLAGELLVSLPPSKRRRVGPRSLLSNLYALGSFDQVLVENHFGSVLHTLLLNDESPLRELVLALPAEPASVEFTLVSKTSIASSWAADPGFQVAAVRYATSKGNSGESLEGTCSYLYSTLALARRFDATIIAHPDRAPLYDYWFENSMEFSSAGTNARIEATLPQPADCIISAERARRLAPMLAAWSMPALIGRLVQYRPMSYPRPRSLLSAQADLPQQNAGMFGYEFLSVATETEE